jgi:hypothetical protein
MYRNSFRKAMLLAVVLSGLTFPGLAAAQNVSLNLVAVGVNQYRAPDMNLTYAVPDAQQVAAVLNSNPLFGRKDVNVLLNQQATLRNIQAAVELMERRATPNSYSVLYLSGHGSRDQAGHFRYIPHDFDPANPAATAVSGEALYARLKKMPGRVFLILDACHSGSAGWTKTHFVKPDTTNQTVIISSSLARELSLELPAFKNGAFTQAFLEAMGGAGDANKDGTLTLQEMHNYVYTRVAQITKGQQHMKTFVPTVAHGGMTLAVVPRPPVAAAAIVWQGQETLPGFGALSFAFGNNGQVTMTDAKARSAGTWSQQGNVVTLRFSNGRVVYTGRVNGTTMSGTATNGSRTWNFNVTRR